jgi:hypothetical protein
MPPRLQAYLKNKDNKPNKTFMSKSVQKTNISNSVLFLNHKKQECGVYQYGKRVYDILKNSCQIYYEYREIETEKEYKDLINNVLYKAIIYNYQTVTMPWLNSFSIDSTQQNIGILHECDTNFFEKKISIDPNTQETPHYYNIPRPLIENALLPRQQSVSTNALGEFISYCHGETPIFGSFGFGFTNKGFVDIVKMINEQYNKAIIKFIIPCAHFGGDPATIKQICEKCFEHKTKKDIILMIHTDFVSEHDLLVFLQSNTMNIFLYDNLHGRGISSTIDYALSVRRPLGISDSFMFRHIYSDEICLYKNSIQTCMENSVAYCEKFISLYSHSNMIDKFYHIIHSP